MLVEDNEGTAFPELGHLESVDVRKAWSHEAHEFTPWLSKNLDRLSSVLGVKLELVDTELHVGAYRADIVARITSDDDLGQINNMVVIENQLAGADLQHLGQILAYLSGLKARIAVWIAVKFGEEHLSAIRWLNEHTTDPYAFFAVKVDVVRIGDSQLAPVFNVLERPNEWNRQVERAAGLSELGEFRRDFWAYYAARHPDAPGLRPGYANSNVWHRDERNDLWLTQFLAQDRVGVYLIGNHHEMKEAIWPRIEPHLGALQEALSAEPLLHGEKHCCVTEFKINSRDRDNWSEMVDWLEDRRKTYERVLQGSSDGTK